MAEAMITLWTGGLGVLAGFLTKAEPTMPVMTWPRAQQWLAAPVSEDCSQIELSLLTPSDTVCIVASIGAAPVRSKSASPPRRRDRVRVPGLAVDRRCCLLYLDLLDHHVW